MIESLTPRERQVLQLIVAGCTTKELATELGISFKTAACHRQRVLDKCGAGNTAELVRRAVQKGWIANEVARSVEPEADETADPLLDSGRIGRAFDERRKYRALLVASVLRARALQGQCKAASAELRDIRKTTRDQCLEILARTEELVGTVRGSPTAVRKAT